MPSLFSKIRGKDAPTKLKSKKHADLEGMTHQLPSKPRWEDAYTRTTVGPEEVQELVRRCTEELKTRALDLPFLLLPFRPTSDPSAVRTFIRHFFDDGQKMLGEALAQELRMTEPMVISGVLKWCWSRLQGGIVGWDAYELFKVGESDSTMARDSFSTFIPLSVDSEYRCKIIFDYFDLLSAIAAHGKMNGFGGRKLSRMASWWAFEHKDTGNGFDGGYKAWLKAANATSHLFFAYLRSLAPSAARGGISMLPRSLQKLLQETDYPPPFPAHMQSSTNRVVMIVDTVSPTPFALLRRANHFQYRDDDQALRDFSEYEDPVMALTEECRRVLKAISLANQSQVSSSKHSTSLRDASWSRFEDIGFSETLEEDDESDDNAKRMETRPQGLRTSPAAGGTNLGRPTTPSWADFLSSGFVDDSANTPSNLLLPPDKILPPIETGIRQKSSQSHRARLESDRLEPGELASITRFDFDDAFWWVWMSSLAPEETAARKSAFGRCAIVETAITAGRWLVMEEMVKGSAPEPDSGAYIAEKKGLFSWTKRNKTISRSKSTGKRVFNRDDSSLKAGANDGPGTSKTSIGPDQQAKIHAAAQKLHAKEVQEKQNAEALNGRRGRSDAEVMKEKTNSIFTLQSAVVSEASPAMKWATKYDKESTRQAYLSDTSAGRGHEVSTTSLSATANGHHMPPVSEAPTSPGPASVASPERKPSVASPSENGGISSEKALEPSVEVHPAERSKTGRDTPLPPTPNEQEDLEASRQDMLSPEPDLSPESKKKHKLQKDGKKDEKKGGLRKLFSRAKSRQSKLPDNAAASVNGMLAQDKTAAEADAPPAPTPEPGAQRPEPIHTESNIQSDAAFETPMEQPEDLTPTGPSANDAQEPTPAAVGEPTFDPPAEGDHLSRVDTADADEADREFSKFDQGPLVDQPAFVPDESDDDADDATPPPIALHADNHPAQEPAASPEEAPSPNVPTHDRWATIRKNAAERAQRQSEEQSHGGQSKTTDGDDETSGEETIESRVARIKARVAELTGNMETSNGPANAAARRS